MSRLCFYDTSESKEIFRVQGFTVINSLTLWSQPLDLLSIKMSLIQLKVIFFFVKILWLHDFFLNMKIVLIVLQSKIYFNYQTKSILLHKSRKCE